MQEVIAIGEIWAGVAYIVAGFGFLALSQIVKDSKGKTSVVKLVAAAIFIVAGAEELFDAFLQEGSGPLATSVQIVCTSLQVVVNTLACWGLYEANRWQWSK